MGLEGDLQLEHLRTSRRRELIFTNSYIESLLMTSLLGGSVVSFSVPEFVRDTQQVAPQEEGKEGEEENFPFLRDGLRAFPVGDAVGDW